MRHDLFWRLLTAAALLLTGSAPGEVSLRYSSSVVSDQAGLPYCGIYSMATFLDLWQNNRRTDGKRLPPIDPAFLALVYNRTIGSGACGTARQWLAFGLQKHGVLPQGATPVGDATAGEFLRLWRDLHAQILDADQVDWILSSRFHHEKIRVDSFTPAEYLRKGVGLDFRELQMLITTHREASRWRDPKEVDVPVYRDESFDAAALRMERELKHAGFGNYTRPADPDEIYEAIITQLHQNRPAAVTLNLGLVKGKLRDYSVVTSPSLHPPGEWELSHHAVVAIAHCDKWVTDDPICAKFAALMKERNIADCIVLQNSWGAHRHIDGLFAVSRQAARRFFTQALVLANLPKRCAPRLVGLLGAPSSLPL